MATRFPTTIFAARSTRIPQNSVDSSNIRRREPPVTGFDRSVDSRDNGRYGWAKIEAIVNCPGDRGRNCDSCFSGTRLADQRPTQLGFDTSAGETNYFGDAGI